MAIVSHHSTARKLTVVELPAAEMWRLQRRLDIAALWVVVYALERLHHSMTSCEDAVRQQECVEKVDAEKSQISQTIQQSIN